MAKNKKISVWKWRGILTDCPRAMRIGIFILLATASASLAFTQLGLVGLGMPGHYIAYGNIMLTVIALGGMFFGIPLGTLLGAIAGTMMSAHAMLQPLDNYEVMFTAPESTIPMFVVIAFLTSLFMALALRGNPTGIRRFVYLVIVCFVVSTIYSVA